MFIEIFKCKELEYLGVFKRGAEIKVRVSEDWTF